MQTKRWWQSKTVLGALAALIATGVRALAPDASVEEGEVLEVLTEVAQTAGMILAIVGRFMADRPLVTKGQARANEINAANERAASWAPPGSIVRVGIAAEEIKYGAAVSIDARGRVRVFRDPSHTTRPGPGGYYTGGVVAGPGGILPPPPHIEYGSPELRRTPEGEHPGGTASP